MQVHRPEQSTYTIYINANPSTKDLPFIKILKISTYPHLILLDSTLYVSPLCLGLGFYKLPLDLMYRDFIFPWMSRADWYALAGATAVEFAAELTRKFDAPTPLN